MVITDGMVRITRGAIEMIVNTANFGPLPAQQVNAKIVETEESQRRECHKDGSVTEPELSGFFELCLEVFTVYLSVSQLGFRRRIILCYLL